MIGKQHDEEFNLYVGYGFVVRQLSTDCTVELKQSKNQVFVKYILPIPYSEWENYNEAATSAKIVEVYIS